MTRNAIPLELARVEEDDSQPLAGRIAWKIRAQIIDGRRMPGTQLREADLVSEFGVSRNTLREALQQLCRDGLATFVRNRGVVVRTLDRASLRDIYTVRRVLELQALRGHPAVFESPVLDAMRATLELGDQARAAGNWRKVGTHSLEFHQQVVALLGSAALNEFFKNILAQLRLVFAMNLDEASFQQPWLVRDREIFERIEAGQWDAAQSLLLRYIDDSEQALLAYV